MEKFIDYCKDIIEDNIFDFINKEVCIDEFSYELTENANFNNTDKAKEFINEWWNEAAEFVDDDLLFDKRCEISNYFRDPKQFMINMVRWGVDCLITDCTFIQDNWGDTIVIKEKDIENMWKEIKNMEQMKYD